MSEFTGHNSRDYRNWSVEQRRFAETERGRSLCDLEAKFGFAFPSAKAPQLLRDCERIGFMPSVWGASWASVACRVTLGSRDVVDPCVLIFYAPGGAISAEADRVLVGGQIASIARSPLALPRRIAVAASQTQEYAMGSYLPLLVSIDGDRRYLARSSSRFFRYEAFTGSDVDPGFWARPSDREHRLGHYRWGDDLRGETTTVYVRAQPTMRFAFDRGMQLLAQSILGKIN